MKRLFSKTKKPISNELDKKFKHLLRTKKEFRKISKMIDNYDGSVSRDELNLRFEEKKKELLECERAMINIKKGLYFGIGYPLGQLEDPKPVPVYAKWANLNNHVGFKGTTRVGKTVSALGQIDQCIANGMNVIVVDPKGSEGQEVLASVIESCYAHDRSKDFNYFSLAYPSLSEYINVLYGKSNTAIASDIIQSIKTPNMETFYLDVGERILLSITTSFEYLEYCTDPTGEITRLLEQEELVKYKEFMSKRKKETDKTNKCLIPDEDVIDRFFQESDHELLQTFENFGFNRTLITFKDLQCFSSYDQLEKLYSIVKVTPVNPGPLHSEIKLNKLRDEAIRLLESALASDKAHFSKVSDTLSNRLLQLSIGPVGSILCNIRINPLMNRLIRDDIATVTVIQPAPMKFRNTSNVFMKMLLGMLSSLMGTVGSTGVLLNKRIMLFIDEPVSIIFPGIEDFLNKAGGLGISVFLYTQTDEDYESVVGKSIAGMMGGNLNTTGIMRLTSAESAIRASKMIGSVQKYKTLAMVSGGGSEGRYSTDVTEEYICKPEDIMALPIGEGIFIHDKKTYYMEFPFRESPNIKIVMPEIEGEGPQRLLAEYEREYEDKQENTDEAHDNT